MAKEKIKYKDKCVEVKEIKDKDKKVIEVKVCGKDCEVFSRVVGYYRPTRQWHDGKQEEFRIRKEFDEEKSMRHKFKDEKTGDEPDKGKLTSFTEKKNKKK